MDGTSWSGETVMGDVLFAIALTLVIVWIILTWRGRNDPPSGTV